MPNNQDMAWQAPATGVLIVDAALCEQGFRELYTRFQNHQLDPLLLLTDYQALAELGPVMITGQPLEELWTSWQRHWQELPCLQYAIWLEMDMDSNATRDWLLARLKVRFAQGREYWMRWGDSRPLGRAFSSSQLWPKGFWHGVESVRFMLDGRCQRWRPEAAATENTTLFGHALLHCLANGDHRG